MRRFDLVVDELGADDRFQDDWDGFWNHGGHLLVGQRGAVGNGFVLARGVDLAQEWHTPGPLGWGTQLGYSRRMQAIRTKAT